MAVTEAGAPTNAVEAHPGGLLHVRFAMLPPEHLPGVFETLRDILRARPGGTPVVLDLPVGEGRVEPMELRRRVAYDAELVAEIQRRLPVGSVSLELG